MQSNVACLNTLPEGAEIRRECPALIDPVEAALRISWLPLELNTALIDEVETRCGVEAARSWVHASLLRSMKGTLLKPVVDAVTYLGMGPQHGLKRCSYGWDLFYKESGRVECTHASENEGTIVLSDAPALATTPSYLRAIAAAFEGFAIGFGGYDLSTKITHDKQDKRVEFAVRWSIDQSPKPK